MLTVTMVTMRYYHVTIYQHYHLSSAPSIALNYPFFASESSDLPISQSRRIHNTA